MTGRLTAEATGIDLIPGDPDEVDRLAREYGRYAQGARQAATLLRRLDSVDSGGWVGPAGDAFRTAVGELPDRLTHGEDAFAQAARSLTTYGRILREAQADACAAVRRYAEAEAATRAWQQRAAARTAELARTRATALPLLLVSPGPDPGAEGRQAAERLLVEARARVEAAARLAAAGLREAGRAAPREPGLLARATRALGSFLTGAGEAGWSLAEFTFRATWVYALIDPKGSRDDAVQLVDGLRSGFDHPAEFGKAVLDWDTWRDDPARALGHLLPDLLLTVGTAGGGAAARGGRAVGTLERIGDRVDALERAGSVFPRLPADTVAARVTGLGYDVGSPAGRAAAWQLHRPYGQVDAWRSGTRAAGDRIAFGLPGVSGFGADPRVLAATGAHARRYFEGLQAAPRRLEHVLPPTSRREVGIYAFTRDTEVATSAARANPQFGRGGLEQVYVPDAEALIDEERLVLIKTIDLPGPSARSGFEDPRFTFVGPDLPARPLDPVREQVLGGTQGAAAGALGGALAGAAADRKGCAP
jgi:hypothetical protein